MYFLHSLSLLLLSKYFIYFIQLDSKRFKKNINKIYLVEIK